MDDRRSERAEPRASGGRAANEGPTAEDVAAAAAALLDDALFCVPDGFDPAGRLNPLPDVDEPSVHGRKFHPRITHLGRSQVRAVVGREGVSVRTRTGTTTIRVEEAVGLFRWQNRRRLIVAADGRTLTLADGVHWRFGRELLRLIEQTYPGDLWIDQDDELPVPNRRRIPYIVVVHVGIFLGGMVSAAVHGLGAPDAVPTACAVLTLALLVATRWASPHLERRWIAAVRAEDLL